MTPYSKYNTIQYGFTTVSQLPHWFSQIMKVHVKIHLITKIKIIFIIFLEWLCVRLFQCLSTRRLISILLDWPWYCYLCYVCCIVCRFQSLFWRLRWQNQLTNKINLMSVITCSILLELSEKEVEHCQTMTDCHRFNVLYSSANKQGQSDSVS